ncbi:hypothetical protein LCGC14_1830820 [marine sediment metagenome]|uniref:CARDB domain-containing protein n=1 Tax=marine sediment metagenome TaxID=412755 RepID=A0A0F9GGG0_9ZZZZ
MMLVIILIFYFLGNAFSGPSKKDLEIKDSEIKISAPGIDLLDRGPAYSGFSPTEVLPTISEITIWADIFNNGSDPSGSFNVSFRASFNPTISTLDTEVGKVTVPSINAGDNASISYTGIFPEITYGSYFGGYFIGWIIDVDDDVVEDDESYSSNTVYIPASWVDVVNKSDLRDRGPAYSGMSSMSVVPGVSLLSVYTDVENRGLKSAESFNVSFYASPNTNITTSDHFLGDEIIPLDFLNGTYADADWVGTFPNITDGSYYIGWIIDVLDDVDEAHEDNNQAHLSTQLIVDATAPTSLLSFTPIAGPYTVDKSTEFTITSDDGSGSGIDDISYRIDGGTWNEYTGLFTLSSYASGNHTIEYFAVDILGNTESIKSVEIYIQPPSGGIPGYDPFLIIGILASLSAIFIISKQKKKKF